MKQTKKTAAPVTQHTDKTEKMKALELLGKCLDLFEPQPEAPDNKIEVSVRVVEEQGKD